MDLVCFNIFPVVLFLIIYIFSMKFFFDIILHVYLFKLTGNKIKIHLNIFFFFFYYQKEKKNTYIL